MQIKNIVILIFTLISPLAMSNYEKPVKELSKLVEAKRFPTSKISPSGKFLALLYPKGAPSIKEVAKKELRLAGLRIDPKTFTSSRIRRKYSSIEIINLKTRELIYTQRARSGAFIYPKWNPKSDKLAYLHLRDNGGKLALMESPSFKTKFLETKQINAVVGSNFYRWSYDGKSIDYLARPKGLKLPRTDTSLEPVIQESKQQKTAVRTYQDLIKSPSDEKTFSFYFTSQLRSYNLNGNDKAILSPALILDFSPSPSGDYKLVTELKKPFSYLVPYYRFPKQISVFKGKSSVRTIAKLAASDTIPQGFSATYEGPRSVQWVPYSKDWIIWVEALDKGDPKNKVPSRDRLKVQKGPLQKAETLKDLEHRFSRIYWNSSNDFLVYDRWWSSRKENLHWIQISKKESRQIFKRSFEDVYSDPGKPLLRSTGLDLRKTALHNGAILFKGMGYSKNGSKPFLQGLNLEKASFNKLWQSNRKKKHQEIISSLASNSNHFILRQESNKEYPNYYTLNLSDKKVSPLTTFKHPYPEFKDIRRIDLNYKRSDGLPLSATLYLPPNSKKGEKLPVVLWAYPREFKSKSAAGQNKKSPNKFNRVSYWGPMPFLSQGFAVMHRVAMPIVGEGGEEPNDTFVNQLVDNAKAALKAGEKTGYVDSSRAVIGGHSYGAFMTANLLAHSNLFKAGIARSGAYNRTFTPFGFQAEERTYWQAPKVYQTMSPFQNAEKINEPLLLIHGEKDNNPGTFPVQSTRLYHAISGLGGTARLVVLPHESHGYKAKESLLHMLWEENRWIKKYLQ